MLFCNFFHDCDAKGVRYKNGVKIQYIIWLSMSLRGVTLQEESICKFYGL